MLVYPIGKTEACSYAVKILEQKGVPTIDHPTPEVTHLLLDCPTFRPDGKLRDGSDLRHHLERLPSNIILVGGNLNTPNTDAYSCIDFLKDPEYLAINAAITAECALRVAGKELKTTFNRCSVLIFGWGRIGKCLGRLLTNIGANVTIAARKQSDIAMLKALGMAGQDIRQAATHLHKYRLVFNTVPEMILTKENTKSCSNCILIDLASKRGIEGPDVIWARGLPGVLAPESSGQLIAETFLRLGGRN